MWKYFSFINFGNTLYNLARNGTPQEALTSHIGQQKFTRCLFKYIRMGKHPEPIKIPAVLEVTPKLGSYRAKIYRAKIYKEFPNFIKEKYFGMNFQILTSKFIVWTKSASEGKILRSRQFFRHP